jgi:hypothetical protein
MRRERLNGLEREGRQRGRREREIEHECVCMWVTKWIKSSYTTIIQQIRELNNIMHLWGSIVLLLLLLLLLCSPLLEPGWFFSLLILYTIGRTLWMGDQPITRPLPTHRTTQMWSSIRVWLIVDRKLKWNNNKCWIMKWLWDRPSAIIQTIHIKLLKEKNRRESVKQAWPIRYHEQIHVSHILGCHVMFPDHEDIRHLSEHGRSFWMCKIVLGTPHCVEVSVGACCNRCICFRQMCLIQRHVSMLSSFLM